MKKRFLPNGGRIAVVSPSGRVSDEIVATSVELIEAEGYKVEVMPHVLGYETSVFSATDADRASDFEQAILRDDIDAIICARGGYGAVRTLQAMRPGILESCNKWIVGFSDITAIHSRLTQVGSTSLHGPMLKHIATHGMDSDDVRKTFDIMRGRGVSVDVPTCRLNRPGVVDGVVTGGNLSLVYSLRNTPADIIPDGRILFLEDLSEYNYHIDRMMQNLKYSGVLERLGGLIVGQLTGMKDGATSYGKEAAEIITDAVSDYDYPVLVGYQAGHANDVNMPLVMGARAKMTIGGDFAKIEWEASSY